MLSFRKYIDAAAALFVPASETALFAGLPRVAPAAYEKSAAPRDRALRHLLRANHHNHAALRGAQPNALPHALGAAFVLGASAAQLHALFDAQQAGAAPWAAAPGELGEGAWRDHLGDRE